MSSILHIDALTLGAGFFVLMLLAGWAGAAMAAKHPPRAGQEESTRIEDACIALFALLLAFSFSGAADRYEHRKQYLLDEAIAIGDFATTASMIEGPSGRAIHEELRRYVELRLQFGRVHIDAPEMQDVTAQSRASQQKILEALRAAIADKQAPTLHTPLMNGFNGVTMTHDRAYYGSKNQVPDTIIVLLILFGLVSAFMVGRSGHKHGKLTSTMTRIAVYTVLVTAVFTVTMDLEQPHRGLMRNPQASLVDLLASLQQP